MSNKEELQAKLDERIAEARVKAHEASSTLNVDRSSEKIKNLQEGVKKFQSASTLKNKSQLGKKISGFFSKFSKIATWFKAQINAFKTSFKKQINFFKDWFSHLGKKSERQVVDSHQTPKNTTDSYANSDLKKQFNDVSAKNQQKTLEKQRQQEQQDAATFQEGKDVEGVDDNNRDEKLGRVNDKSGDLKDRASDFKVAGANLAEHFKNQSSAGLLRSFVGALKFDSSKKSKSTAKQDNSVVQNDDVTEPKQIASKSGSKVSRLSFSFFKSNKSQSAAFDDETNQNDAANTGKPVDQNAAPF